MTPTLDSDDVRQVFDRLLADEPAMASGADTAARLGRRLRRRRQARYLAGGGLGVGALLAVALVAWGGGDTSPATTETAAPDWQFVSSEGVPAAPGEPAADQSDLARRMIDAIRASSPEGWTFDLREQTMPGVGDGWLDGTVDDGTGPGRLLVHVAREPGMVTLHPCEDPDFVQGGTCQETVLPDGSVLSVRGLVDFDGVRYVDVSLAHPDGSGIGAESGNFVIPQVSEPLGPGSDIPEGGRVRLVPPTTRPDPAYTADQLADLVLAVDQATR